MTVFLSFGQWVEAEVLARREQKRLDGATTGGNRTVAGRFRHGGKAWKVHADTHLEPLLLAYEAQQAGADPFKVGRSRTGLTLELIDDLQARRRTRHKHLYIYEQKQS